MDYADGYITFRKFKTYYRIFGAANNRKAPLLVVNGGPGSSHHYILGLAELADERQVIFYDQLGSGSSDRPTDNTIWTLELFLEELSALREQLGLGDIHLLGHSWGGMLAIEYLLSKPAGIQSVVLASAMVSIPLYQKEVEKLKHDLPPGARKALAKHEAAGTTDSAEYLKAMAQYNKRHIYRGTTYPDELNAPKGAFCDASYKKLWGVSEAYANGDLRNWDRIPRLKEIAVPTLITSGQYDELTPQQAVITHDAIAGSCLKIFTAGSHLVHIEHAAEYTAVLREFLESVEASA